MKNYTFGWAVRGRGMVEVPVEQYTDAQKNMAEYIEILSETVRKANCGWDGVRYVVIKYPNDKSSPYMVLWVKNGGERWIPIEGNSKGCNLSVLGENLW